MNKNKVFLLIAVFWIVIIVGFVAVREFTLQTGEEVLLKTRPVDPRDMFRGDYVILNYDISTLNPQQIQSDSASFFPQDKVYVVLAKQGGYHVATGIFKNQPENELFIKGTVKDADSSRINVEYGIESYFVPEGKGREIERYTGRGLEVKASVDKFGNAGIKDLLIDGEKVKFE